MTKTRPAQAKAKPASHRWLTPERIIISVLGSACVVLSALLVIRAPAAQSDARPVLTGSLQVAGSESMRPFVAACAEHFMAAFPDTDVVVKGGGTGDGISALFSGLSEIAMVSRPLAASEEGHARTHGITLAQMPLAQDAIALIVHPDNPVTDLALPDIAAIFTGQVENWQAFAGNDTAIMPLGRAKGSGTADFFDATALAGQSEVAAQQRATNEAIVADVAANPGAIGYTGLGALRNAGSTVRVLALRTTPDAPAILPRSDAGDLGDYPLVRTLSLISTLPQDPLITVFVDHCNGPDVRVMAQNFGYVPASAAPNKAKP